MRFLQTGDLHLGKIFYERSLIDDQRYMLSQLASELENAAASGTPYDALLLTGDIYDRAVPPPEAVGLFDEFLTRTHKNHPELHIFILSGNHDSGRRLAFAAQLLESQNIHIAAAPEQITQPIILERATHCDTTATETDGTYTESVAVYSIPFLSSGCMGGMLHRQHDMVSEAVRLIQEHHEKHNPNSAVVVCAHLFTQNGTPSDSERVFVGATEQVATELFTPFAYTALGHLHHCQNPADKIWYSGSPLAYSFDEAGTQKFFLRVELDFSAKGSDSAGKDSPGQPSVSVQKIPVSPLRPVARLQGRFEEFYRDTDRKYAMHSNDYLEIICIDDTLIENPMATLRPAFPNLLSFRQENAIRAGSSASIESRRTLLQNKQDSETFHEQLFTAFMNDTHETLPENFLEEKELFLKLARDVETEER